VVVNPSFLLPRNLLGQTGITVSCVGLGTVKIGRNEGVKYPSGFALPDDDRVLEILTLCRELGINLIDTAPAYGGSEERLGQVLPRVTGSRQDWVICTKVGEEFNNGVSSFDFSAGHVRRSIERSLRRLQTDYLDIVLVHSDGRDEEIITQSDCFEALQRCREAGLIRAFGMSTKTVAGGLLAAEHSDVVMVTYHPGATEDGLVIDHARTLHKGVLIKKALNSGHAVPADQVRAEDPVKASLEFIFRRAGISSVIIGSISPAHLRQNIASAMAITA